MWYTHTAVYNSTINKNEVLIPAMIRMNLETMMWSERNQTQRTHVTGFNLHEVSRVRQTTETEDRFVVGRG